VGRDWSRVKRQATEVFTFRAYPSSASLLRGAAARADITVSALCNALARDLVRGNLVARPGSELERICQASPDFEEFCGLDEAEGT